MEPYYIDESKASDLKRDANETIFAVNKLIELYTQLTTFKIKNTDGLKKLFENPTAFYKAEFFSKNQKTFGAFAGMAELDIDPLIKTPRNFDLLESKVKQFDHTSVTDHFTIVDGKLTTSQAFDKFVEDKTHHYAESSDEKKRLNLALKLIQSYEALEEIMLDTMGENRSKHYLVASKGYIPDFKVYGGQNPIIKRAKKRGIISGNFATVEAELCPNPKFVRFGFKEGKSLNEYSTSTLKYAN